jgi:hypothetical protein
MHDYEVWFKGTSIDYIKADTDRKALNLAKKIYGAEVTVTKVAR